jgi:hypothetical protein
VTLLFLLGTVFSVSGTLSGVLPVPAGNYVCVYSLFLLGTVPVPSVFLLFLIGAVPSVLYTGNCAKCASCPF